MAAYLSRLEADWCNTHLAHLGTFEEGDEVPQISDGLYVGLPEGLYFGQKGRLGSTDHGRLWLYKEGWWWMSSWNPWLRDDDTKAKAFGSALHCFLLEGKAEFRRRFAVGPDPRAYPSAIMNYEDLLSALLAAGAPGVRRGKRMKELADLAEVYVERPVWFTIEEHFERTLRGRTAISASDAYELEVMRDACKAEPRVRAILKDEAGDAPHLAELSVLYTVDGVPCRFRFDLLTPPLAVDLKTLGGFNTGESLQDTISKRIGGGALDVQAAMSFEARTFAYSFVSQGLVWGGTEAEQAFLALFPSRAPLDGGGQPGWGWAWVFHQRPDQKGRPPIVVDVWMTFASPEHLEGLRKMLWARRFYREKVAAVGLEKPWTRTSVSHGFNGAAADRIEIKPWVARPDPYPGEEEMLKWRG